MVVYGVRARRSRLTLGHLGRAKAGASTPFAESIWTYSYNDRALADVEVPPEWDPRHRRFLELLALVLAFAPYERNLKIEDRVDGVPGRQESPDFFVSFQDGARAVEVARLTDEGRTRSDSLVQKIDANLQEAFKRDVALAARFANVSISIRLAIRDAKGFSDHAVTTAIVDRLMRVPDGHVLAMGFITPGPTDSLLKKHAFFLTFNKRHHRWTQVAHHLPNDRIDQEQALRTLIQRKNRPRYDTRGLPLWLVIAISDPFGQLTYDLESYAERSFAIGKFERMIVANGFASVRTKPEMAA